MQNRKNAYCKCKIWNLKCKKQKKKWTMHIKIQKVKWATKRPSPMHSDKGERSACDTRLHFAFNFQIKRKSNFLWRISWKTTTRLWRDSQFKKQAVPNASKEKLETWQFDFVLSVFFFQSWLECFFIVFFCFYLDLYCKCCIAECVMLCFRFLQGTFVI